MDLMQIMKGAAHEVIMIHGDAPLNYSLMLLIFIYAACASLICVLLGWLAPQKAKIVRRDNLVGIEGIRGILAFLVVVAHFLGAPIK